MDNATEIAAKIRNSIKAKNIKAHVSVKSGAVRVSVVTYETKWTPAEQHAICTIAIAANMTFVRGVEIELDRHASHDMNGQNYFFYPK